MLEGVIAALAAEEVEAPQNFARAPHLLLTELCPMGREQRNNMDKVTGTGVEGAAFSHPHLPAPLQISFLLLSLRRELLLSTGMM